MLWWASKELLKKLPNPRQGGARAARALRRALRVGAGGGRWTASGIECVCFFGRKGSRGEADPLSRNVYIDFNAYRKGGGYKLIADCLAGKRTREEITKIMEDSALRGLGGAGFPTGRKWKIVAAEPAPRLMAVNIDEGEPGTFKDRWYLERDPHRFLEGMLVAAWCAGVGEIYIYLRDEYAGCRAILEKELSKLKSAESLSTSAHSPPTRRRRLHLRRRVGDDRVDRGQARHAAPAAAVRRAGRPVRLPDARAQHGDRVLGARDRREGRRLVRRAGPQRPQGPALVLGVRPREKARRARRARGHHGAPADRRVSAAACSRATGSTATCRAAPPAASCPRSLGDVPLDFDTLQPHGCFIGSAAVVILSDKDEAAAAARNLMKFFMDESCGQCTPCRVGTAKALGLMGAKQWNQPLLKELSQAMMDASICGLGQAAPNPALSVMKFFPQEVG